MNGLGGRLLWLFILQILNLCCVFQCSIWAAFATSFVHSKSVRPLSGSKNNLDRISRDLVKQEITCNSLQTYRVKEPKMDFHFLLSWAPIKALCIFTPNNAKVFWTQPYSYARIHWRIQGGTLGTQPPRPNFFYFHAKILQNNRFSPPTQELAFVKSWIRHWDLNVFA